MYTKLTLNIDHRVVENAKRYAKAKKRSVSNLVSDYLAAVSSPGQRKTETLGPITRELAGVIKADPAATYTDILTSALMEKHL